MSSSQLISRTSSLLQCMASNGFGSEGDMSDESEAFLNRLRALAAKPKPEVPDDNLFIARANAEREYRQLSKSMREFSESSFALVEELTLATCPNLPNFSKLRPPEKKSEGEKEKKEKEEKAESSGQ